MKTKKIPVVKSFRLDADFYHTDNAKILKGKHGMIGLLTLNVLLCEIWRNGYFLKWDLAARYRIIDIIPDLSVDALEEIMCTIVQIGIIDEQMFVNQSVVTSIDIQHEYFKARKPRKNVEYVFLLVEIGQKPSAEIANKEFNRKATPWAPTLSDVVTSLDRHNIGGHTGSSPAAAAFHQYYTNRDWCYTNGERVTRWKEAFKLFVASEFPHHHVGADAGTDDYGRRRELVG